MANRNLLHISKLEGLKEWLTKDGWKIEQPKGEYEVVRARKPGRKDPLIIYRKQKTREYLSIMDRDNSVVAAFLRDKQNPEIQQDRIIAMDTKKLAEFLFMVDQKEGAIPYCKEHGACDPLCEKGEEIPKEMCIDCMVEWLQSKVDEEAL